MKFKVFFSWQSDFVPNTAFIRDCIDDAINEVSETESVEAIRDEATKDTTGAPDIVATLFSKIDECDMFVADVTNCFECKVKDGKKSPNPNVLLELGYAVKTVGWDRIICLCNKGAGIDLPFDFNHNRVTFFSTQKEQMSNERKRISDIIKRNILAIKEKGPKVSLQKNYAHYRNIRLCQKKS